MTNFITHNTFAEIRENLVKDTIYTIEQLIKKHFNLNPWDKPKHSLNIKLEHEVFADCYSEHYSHHNVSNVELDTDGKLWFIGVDIRVDIHEGGWNNAFDFLDDLLQVLENQMKQAGKE